MNKEKYLINGIRKKIDDNSIKFGITINDVQLWSETFDSEIDCSNAYNKVNNELNDLYAIVLDAFLIYIKHESKEENNDVTNIVNAYEYIMNDNKKLNEELKKFKKYYVEHKLGESYTILKNKKENA